MFIPVGLIMRGLQEVEDEQFRSAMRQQDMISQVEMYQRRAEELFAACTGPDACLLVVANMDGAQVALDDVPAFTGYAPQPFRESPYAASADPLGPPPHGFFAVCPGLHVLTTHARGVPVGRAITMAPATAQFVRLDQEAAAFVDLDPTAAEAARTRSREGTLALFDYNTLVAQIRVQSWLARSNHEAHLAALPDLLEAFGALTRGATEKAWLYARRAQIMLTGAPIPTFSRVLKLVADHDARLRGLGRRDEARAWIEMMSWVVPGLEPIEAAKAELTPA